MAIKTDELQQTTAPALTDTLLLANSAGGTAQLSMAQAAAFFDAELLKSGTALSAALSSKAALSAQETVEATGVTSREITVEAAELQTKINELPRLLTEHITINVSGEVNVYQLNISGLFGGGSLTVQSPSNDAVFKTRTVVSGCSVPIHLKKIRFVDPAPGSTENRNAISALSGARVYLDSCSFSSEDGGNSHVKSYRGVNVSAGSFLQSYNMQADHCGVVALISSGAIAVLHTDSAAGMHDNFLGAYIYECGILLLGGSMPNLLGGASNGKVSGGGIIVAANSTLI